MANVKQTLATFMASFFGKSETVISEKLSTDEHNQFTTEALEIQEKLTGLQDQVTSLEGEKATLEASITTLTGEKTTLENDKTTLQSSLTETEGDRDKYKAWFEKQAGVGAQLPNGDETSKGENNLTPYNQQALEVFRKANK